MPYLRLNLNQLNTLKNLPTNLNNILVCNNISGIICINKSNEIKHIVLDFESYNMDEFFLSTKDKKTHLFKHIKNPNQSKYYILSFEIQNIFKKTLEKQLVSFYYPDIYQWIKCVIFSIYRNIFNHLIFSHSNNIYVISMKKRYYYNLYRQKYIYKISIKDIYHKLMQDYLNIFNNNKSTTIPDKFYEYFHIQKFDLKNDMLFNYYSYNPLNVISIIK